MSEKKQVERYKSGRKKKGHSSYILLYIFLGLLAIITLVVLSLTVFFPIKTVKVSGKNPYNSEQIIESANIKMNTNLFTSDVSQVEGNITKQLPYIKSVKISRRFPSTIVLNVETAEVYLQIEQGGKYIFIDDNAKCLEISTKINKNAPLVRTAKSVEAQVGKTVKFSEYDGYFDTLCSILSSCKKHELDITVLNVSNKSSVWATYNNKIVLMFGSSANIDEKLEFAKGVVNSRKNNDETGTLNLSRIPNTKNQASFISSELTSEQKR